MMWLILRLSGHKMKMQKLQHVVKFEIGRNRYSFRE
jgi:hypothetical protein